MNRTLKTLVACILLPWALLHVTVLMLVVLLLLGAPNAADTLDLLSAILHAML